MLHRYCAAQLIRFMRLNPLSHSAVLTDRDRLNMTRVQQCNASVSPRNVTGTARPSLDFGQRSCRFTVWITV